jgi:O-antigen/teichoic acid export membrane protein
VGLRQDLLVVLARSVTLNFLGQVGGLAVGFIASILLARWLGPSDRGLLGIMMSIVELGVAFAGVGLPFAVGYYASRLRASSGALLGNSLLFTALLAVVFVPSFWLLQDSIADLVARGEGGEAWVIVAALVPVTFLSYATSHQLSGRLRFGLYNALLIASRVAVLAGVVALVGLLDLGVSGALAATAAGAVLMIVGSLPDILGAGRPRLDWGLLRRMVGYGARVEVGAVFQLLNARLDVVILQFFRPLTEVGYYVIAQIVAELVITLARAFQTSLLPLIARLEGEERQALTTIAAVRHHGILAAAAILVNAVFGTLVIVFGYGPSFRGALLPMLILLPGMWFLGTGTVVAGDLRGRGRPGLSSALGGLAVGVTIGLDLLLIPDYGAVGAAVASLVAYTVFGSTSLVALSRVSGIPLRSLLTPTRADLAVYPAVIGSGLARLQRLLPG